MLLLKLACSKKRKLTTTFCKYLKSSCLFMVVLPLIILRRKFVDQQTFGFCGRVLECLLNYDCTCTTSVSYKAIIGTLSDYTHFLMQIRRYQTTTSLIKMP